MARAIRSLLAGACIAVLIATGSWAYDDQPNLGLEEFAAINTIPMTDHWSSRIVNILTQGEAVGTFFNDDGERELGVGNYALRGVGFVIGDYVLTANHVVDPQSVMIQEDELVYWLTRPIKINSRRIMASPDNDFGGAVDLEILYSDREEDMAILQGARKHRTMHTLMYRFGWSDFLMPGDAVAMVRRKREEGDFSWRFEVVTGTVRYTTCRVPDGYEYVLPWFSMNDATLDLDVIPGDSGSPVFAFDNGVPVLIGIARAGLRVEETWTYMAKLDMAAVFLHALGKDDPETVKLPLWGPFAPPSRGYWTGK